jgi:hypothetical protein
VYVGKIFIVRHGLFWVTFFMRPCAVLTTGGQTGIIN